MKLKLRLVVVLLTALLFVNTGRAQTNLPPVITSQPQNLFTTNGYAAWQYLSLGMFKVTATGTAPLSYQWRFNGTNLPNNSKYSGVTSARFSLEQVTNADAGPYDVVITNAWGSVTSSVATLTIAYPPAITQQPASQGASNLTTVTFSVGATGTGPFTYQWLLNGTNLANNIITTVAGNGNRGYSGDGGAATNASLISPTGVAVDANDNLFIADAGNFRIREVNANGLITTVAGNGTESDTGDGGAATNATLNWPEGVAVDANGNLFIADLDNNRIRQVATNGIITTVAGDGTWGYSGDGGPATNAELSSISHVAVDAAGNLYIADSANHLIRKMDTNGIITTVAGDGAQGYSGDGGPATNASLYFPEGLAVDANGNLFIADNGNGGIRKVDTNGIITTVATAADPTSVTVDAVGDLYIAELLNSDILKVATNGIITTVAGNGTQGDSGDGGAATNASLDLPNGVVVDPEGNLYIADAGNNRIRRVTTQGPVLTVTNVNAANAGNYQVVVSNPWGSMTSSVAALTMDQPPAITSQPVSQDIVNGGNATLSVAVNGTGPGYQWQFNGTNLTDGGNLSGSATPNLNLTGVSVANAGDYQVIITNAWGSATSSVAVLTLVFPPAIAAQPAGPIAPVGGTAGFAVEATGTAPLAYQWQFDGMKLTDGGQVSGSGTTELVLTEIAPNNVGYYRVIITNAWGSATSIPVALTIGVPPAITNQPVSQIIGSGSNASFSVTAIGQGPFYYHWQLNGTNLVASQLVSGLTGPNLFLEHVANSYFAGPYDVVISNAWGSVTSSVATLTLNYPPTVTNQPVSQVITGSTNVTFSVGAAGTGPFSYQWLLNGKIITNNLITTVAGNGTNSNVSYPVNLGDGGAATNASLDNPCSVALDATGNLFIADAGNQRIRRVNLSGIISTVAGNGDTGFNGNGLVATNSYLDLSSHDYWYSGVAVDANDNLVIADTSNNRIREETYDFLLTVAGTGAQGYFGDGGDAYNAGLNRPTGVAVDAAGNIYVADTYNSRIRRVDVFDTITTVAGTNISGAFGDGGPATEAGLFYPGGVAVDAAGNLFIADTSNNRIRKVATNGLIATVAGNGYSAFYGDGGAATNAALSHPTGVAVDASGNLFIADTYNQRIRKVTPAGLITSVAGKGNYGSYNVGDGGAATNASLYYPAGVAVDAAGDLFIADSYDNRIRKVTAQGPVFTVANAGLANAGNYQVIVSSTWGSVTSSVAVLSVDVPPSITVQPTNQSVINGHDTTLRAQATGTAPLAYQWQFNGTNLPASPTRGYNPSGAASTNLTFLPAGATNGGGYTLVITNAFGSVTSSVAVLTIVYPPAITNQPLSQDIVYGSGATLSVGATGTAPLAYQWQFNGTNLPNANFPTSTNASLVLNQVSSANTGSYAVIITNAWGTVTSHAAALTLVYPPAITNPPAALNLLTGQNGAFNVGVSGTGPFTYQWLLNGVALPNPANLPDGIITTVAGTGVAGDSGDGGAATNARLNLPYVLAFDPAGNLYVADSDNHVVRRLDTNGIITTVAGNGGTRTTGYGGPATNASLFAPSGLAADPIGNLFIADGHNNVVLKVDTNGIITPVAGNGTQGYTGDGGAATNAGLDYPAGLALDAWGNLFIADYFNSVIRRIDTNGIITTVAGNGGGGYAGDGGPATNASLNLPIRVATDAAGNLFIADLVNNVIRRVDPNGIITTAAGNGIQSYAGDGGAATNAALDGPEGLTVDAAGNLLIADADNNVIRRVDPNGIITTVVGDGTNGYTGDGGTATNATLGNAADVAVNAAGYLYIADSYNNVIRAVNPYGGLPSLPLSDVTTNNAGNYQVVITNAWGSVTSSVAALSILFPPTLSQPPVSLSVINNSNATFSAVAAGTAPLAYQWQFEGVNLTDGGNLSGSATPNLLLTQATAANAGGYDLVVSNPWGSITSSVVTLTVTYPPTLLTQPVSQTVSNGNPVTFNVGVIGTGPFTYQWLHNGQALPINLITTVAGNGTNGYSGDGGPATNAKLSAPSGVAVGADGNLFIADAFNQRIRMVNASGLITTVAGGANPQLGGEQPQAVAGLPPTDYDLSLSDGYTSPPYYTYSGVAVDADDNLFIADTEDQRVLLVTYDLLLVAAGGGENYPGDGSNAVSALLDAPSGLALDTDGNLFFSDTEHQRVRKVNAAGLITTVAGNGTNGYSGDGGLATNAQLSNPAGVAVDASGNLFIADYANNRVRKVNPAGLITTVAGGGFAGDGGAATNASLYAPVGVAVDADGNLFIADSDNRRIRQVNPAGVITTVAGNGNQVNSYVSNGDGGAATNASFSQPTGVAVDASGDLFIVDTGNNRIRKVTPQGPTLSLGNANATNAGNYQVIVSSASGRVTSSVVTLTLLAPPVITRQPVGLSVIGGGNASFSAGVSGSTPLAYQWQFNGTNLTGGVLTQGRNLDLNLPQVTAANAGWYDVFITNAWGSVTSSIVTLAVSLPQVSAQVNPDGSVTLNLLTAPNVSSEVLAATNLTPPVIWQPMGNQTPGANGLWQFTDTNTYPVRFYRTSTP